MCPDSFSVSVSMYMKRREFILPSLLSLYLDTRVIWLAAAAGCSPLLDGAHHEGVPRAGPQQVPRLLSVLVDLLQPLDL